MSKSVSTAPPVYAVTNRKGGSCKTAAAVNLGAEWAARGQRVLLVDLDPQGNASTWLGVPSDGRELLATLTAGAPLAVVTSAAGVDVVQSGSWLAGIDAKLAGEIGAETLLRQAIDRWARSGAGRYDVVLIDCPPSLGILSVLALTAARGVIVPVLTEAAPLEGVATLLSTIDLVRERLNPTLQLVAAIASKTTRTRLSQEVETQLRSRLGTVVCRTPVRQNVSIAESYSHGQPIRQYAPHSTGAEDFAAVATEVTRRMRDSGKRVH